MLCKNHNKEIAIDRCSICGNWFCEDCVIIDNIKASCNICRGEKTPNKKNVVIREVIEDTVKKTVTDDENKVVDKKVIVKPLSANAARRPRKIISNGESVNIDDHTEIFKHNAKIKNQIIKSNNNNYSVSKYNNYELKKAISSLGTGLIVVFIGSSLGIGVVSIVGFVLIARAIIDIMSSKNY